MSTETEEIKLYDEFIDEMFKMCLLDVTVRDTVVGYVKESYLPTEEQKLFLHEMAIQVQKKMKPSIGSIKVGLRKNDRKNRDKAVEYCDKIQETEKRDRDTILITLQDFIREAMFIQSYDQSAEFYNRGDHTKAYKFLRDNVEKLTNFSLTNSEFIPLYGTFPNRQNERLMRQNNNISEKLPFGIDELDHVTHGGPELGELIMFLGAAKSGKSICLTQLSVNYSRRGFPVAHVQLEGTRKQAENRFDSCWSGTEYHEVKAGEFAEEKLKAYHKIVDTLGKTDVHLFAPERFEAMNVHELRKILIDLIAKYGIKVLIIDYLDLMNPDNEKYSSKDERFRQQKTAKLLKDLAMELKILIITATQASSVELESLNDPEFVITREFLAEDKGKVRPVDMLITINRTKDERKKGICRLHLEAMREHDSDVTITIAQNLKRTRFYDRVRTLNEGYFQDAA